jgi:membrane protease YdiL (CAAX protease family)
MGNSSKSFSVIIRKNITEIFALAWIITAIAVMFPVTRLLDGVFPIFAFGMLAVCLGKLIQNRDADSIGLKPIQWRELARYTGINIAGSLSLMAVFEPWSHTYQILVNEAIVSPHPDTTFGWLVRFPSLAGWAGFVLYAGLVTLFAEELFFRGWLLQTLQSKTRPTKAIIFQAVLFTLPQLLAAFLLPPVQGVLYAIAYSFLAIGLINGWTANQTGSIWPGFVSAIIYNLIMCAITI